MTQLKRAKAQEITKEMQSAAAAEGLTPEALREKIAAGTAVLPQNIRHPLPQAIAVGTGLRVKVNANIGASKDHVDVEEELKKLQAALSAGADAVMDLSTGGDLDAIRKEILKACPVPLGTVPIYQAAVETVEHKRRPLYEMSADDMFRAIEKHAEDGVDFVTVHCGVTQDSVARLRRQGRKLGIVSRGGAFLALWMEHNKKENPLFEQYDRLLEIAAAYDVTLSLGDGLRPGCLADATDRGQVQELVLLGELAARAREKDVQVMIEGPGHMPMDHIAANMLLEKKLCNGAPFYVLGPLVTDLAPGYDHITGAIGGAIAAMAGADFLCYVTAAEHLRLPTVEDVREGVITARIAAHAADLARGSAKAWAQDARMADYRRQLDWQNQIAVAIDPEKAGRMHSQIESATEGACSMCGEFCAIKVFGESECQAQKK